MADDFTWQESAKTNLPLLYKLAFQMLQDKADAEDAVQQALMQTWEKRGRIREETLRAYLCRAVLNESRNLLRKRKRTFPVAELLAPSPETPPDLRPLMRAIAALPDKYRWPVWLRYLEDLSAKEAAAALGLTVAALNSRIHRAKQLLREALEEEVSL